MNTQLSLRAGGYDWLDVWRTMFDAERAQADTVTDPEFMRNADFWSPRAKRFAAASDRVPQPDAFMQRLLPLLRPTDTVLDLGAGTGRYVPLLARTVAQVIALEPSPAMREYLAQRVAHEGITNVTIMMDVWPTEKMPRVDVVISAHVLYSVREIGPFLQAMDAIAERACYLFLMLQHVNMLFSPFWERFHHQVRLPLPAALEAMNVLYQLGYPAQMELVSHIKPFNFSDTDEALNDIRMRLRLVPHPQRDEDIIAAIHELLMLNQDGSLSIPGYNRNAALVWWISQATRTNSG